MSGRGEQTVVRALNQLAAAGIVRFGTGRGLERRPTLAVRKAYVEIDLLEAT